MFDPINAHLIALDYIIASPWINNTLFLIGLSMRNTHFNVRLQFWHANLFMPKVMNKLKEIQGRQIPSYKTEHKNSSLKYLLTFFAGVRENKVIEQRDKPFNYVALLVGMQVVWSSSNPQFLSLSEFQISEVKEHNLDYNVSLLSLSLCIHVSGMCIQKHLVCSISSLLEELELLHKFCFYEVLFLL